MDADVKARILEVWDWLNHGWRGVAIIGNKHDNVEYGI
jgi:hypothetical protein